MGMCKIPIVTAAVIFDLGVYLVVVGVTMTIILTIANDRNEKMEDDAGV